MADMNVINEQGFVGFQAGCTPLTEAENKMLEESDKKKKEEKEKE